MEDYKVLQTGDEIQEILNQAPVDTADIAELKEAATSLDGRLEAVEGKIPSGASSENPLTDKQYVDSSIASASATFRGTYNEVTDLELTTEATHAEIGEALASVIDTADSNDYCFVQIPTADATPTEIESIERYKFVTGTGWQYEYTLNNSGFTADQWAAINSGITSGLVAKLTDLPTNAELNTLLNGKANAADVYTKSETYTKTEIDTQLGAKANSADVYPKTDTYTKQEVNALITTPEVQYVTVTATAGTTAVTDVLPATGAANTIYRVGSWDGTQYDDGVYSEYSWNGSAYILLDVKNYGFATGSDFDNPTTAQRELVTTVGSVLDGISEGVFDLTAKTGDSYATLADALTAANTSIPTNKKKGGMSIKFVQSSDNKYVQYFLPKDEWSVRESDWEKLNLEEDVIQLRHEVNVDIQNAAFAETYIQPINYELGNINIVVSTNTWTYPDSKTRVRTPEGYVLHLFPGDTIGLSSYDNARFYIGWRKLDGSSGGANDWRTDDYVVTAEGIYCILVCNTVDTAQTSAEALGSLIKVVRNTTLSKRISELESVQDGIEILPESAFTLFQDNACINQRGSLLNSSYHKIVTFSARKGDYILLSANNSANISCFAKESDGTNYNSLLVGRGMADYRYIVQTDSTIYISIQKANANNLVVIRNEQYKALMDAEDKNGYFNILAFCEKTHAYVKYSDGSINATSSNIWASTFLTDGIKKVRVFVTGGDEIAAAIAFYSSEIPSASSYIVGVQMAGNLGGGRWYEAEVPSSAITAIVTNHYGYVANPYILVDYVSKDLLGLDNDEEEMPELGIGIVYGYQKAANYDGTFSPIYTLNSYFPQEKFQRRIRLTPLYGIRLNIRQAGVLTIVKATGVLTDNCVMTTIKAFTTTKTGWQVLLFDAPVILSETESLGIGIQTDTAKVVVDSVYGGADAVMTDYLRSIDNNNTWVVYQQNLLIDVLGIPKNDAEEVLTKVQSLEKRDVFAGNNPFRFNGPFYAHLFTDKIYETSTDITIPSESLDDIRVSRRLGFNVIEANVQTTSDGKFVVIHGASGKFGYEVTDLNGDFTYSDTAINSVTLDWIKANIRYRSDIPRFRTAIPTLEEFLRECRLQGMIPFAQASSAAMVALLDGIMGYGNYFAYNGTRALTSAPIVQYLSLTTKEAILEQARSIGVPYVYAMGNYNTFTDDELKDIVSSLHSEGFMIATAYINGANADRVRKLGFDMIASTWNVNNFDNANICTLCVGTDWSDFQITGSSATDSGVELGVSQSIVPKNELGIEFLAKGMLQVTFSGTAYIKCGKDNQTVTFDSPNTIIFSSYFINEAPSFMVAGQGTGAVVTDVVFKASKC